MTRKAKRSCCSTARWRQSSAAGSNGMTLLWVTSEFPVDVAASADRAQTQVGVPPPANGTIFRIVDFAPTAPPRGAGRSS